MADRGIWDREELTKSVFEVVWLSRREQDPAKAPSLLQVSDVDGEPLWLNSYGVTARRNVSLPDLMRGQIGWTDPKQEMLEKIGKNLDLGLPGLLATYMAGIGKESPLQIGGQGMSLFGIAGPPGRDKSTLIALLSLKAKKKWGLPFPIIDLEPKTGLKASVYKEWLVEKGGADLDLGRAREVISQNIGDVEVAWKSGKIEIDAEVSPTRVENLRTKLDRAIEVVVQHQDAFWCLVDLPGFPRIKKSEFGGPPRYMRQFGVYDLLEEAMEYSVFLEERVSVEKGEGLVNIWVNEVLSPQTGEGDAKRGEFRRLIRELMEE